MQNDEVIIFIDFVLTSKKPRYTIYSVPIYFTSIHTVEE